VASEKTDKVVGEKLVSKPVSCTECGVTRTVIYEHIQPGNYRCPRCYRMKVMEETLRELLKEIKIMNETLSVIKDMNPGG